MLRVLVLVDVHTLVSLQDLVLQAHHLDIFWVINITGYSCNINLIMILIMVESLYLGRASIINN